MSGDDLQHHLAGKDGGALPVHGEPEDAPAHRCREIDPRQGVLRGDEPGLDLGELRASLRQAGGDLLAPVLLELVDLELGAVNLVAGRRDLGVEAPRACC